MSLFKSAMARFGFGSGERPSPPNRKLQKEEARGRVPYQCICRISHFVLEDALAMGKWMRVVDWIVPSQSEARRIKKLIVRESEHERAVADSLKAWHAHSGILDDLVAIVGEYRLRSLVGKLLNLKALISLGHHLPASSFATFPRTELEGWEPVALTLARPETPQVCLESDTQTGRTQQQQQPQPSASASPNGHLTAIRWSRSAERPQFSIWFEVHEVVHNFTGRDAELKKLHKLITAPSSPGSHSPSSCVAVTVTVTGLGGVGKSTLVREYAFTYTTSFDDNVIWINAESADSMRASFTRLSRHLNLSTDEAATATNSDLIAKVYKTLQMKTMKYLLIFDNVEDPDDLAQFYPKITPLPYILVTSRQTDLVPPEQQLVLDVLNLEEATLLIREEFPHTKYSDAVRLAERLGQLPIALQQALAYIDHKYSKEDKRSIAKYLEEYGTSESRLLSDEHFQSVTNCEYQFTTLTTLDVSLTRIQDLEQGNEAVGLVKALAFLSPDQISEEFVRKVLEIRIQEVQASRKLLQKFSVINGYSQGRLSSWISIHRLVQRVICLRIAKDEEIHLLGRIVTAIGLELSTYDFTNLTREATTHGAHAFPFLLNHHFLVLTNTSNLSTLCYFLIQYGNAGGALSVAEKASELLETFKTASKMATNTQSIVRLKWRAADAHYAMDNNEKAMTILQRILPIAAKELNPRDEELVLAIRSSMARIWSQMGKYRQALEIYDAIIPAQIQVNGEGEVTSTSPTTPGILTDMLNKGDCLLELDRLDEAEQLFQMVCCARLKKYGRTHLLTARAKRWIGKVASRKGNKNTALAIYKGVYESYKAMLQEDHPNTVSLRSEIEKLEAECS